jgi:hypothetical protein
MTYEYSKWKRTLRNLKVEEWTSKRLTPKEINQIEFYEWQIFLIYMTHKSESYKEEV